MQRRHVVLLRLTCVVVSVVRCSKVDVAHVFLLLSKIQTMICLILNLKQWQEEEWQKECDEVAKPEWWNDEELKVLSARVVRAAPNDEGATQMRAGVLSGPIDNVWEAGPRSAVEFKEAATYYEQAAALCPAPSGKARFADDADWCRSEAEGI